MLESEGSWLRRVAGGMNALSSTVLGCLPSACFTSTGLRSVRCNRNNFDVVDEKLSKNPHRDFRKLSTGRPTLLAQARHEFFVKKWAIRKLLPPPQQGRRRGMNPPRLLL